MAEFNLMVPSFLLDYRSVTLYQEWLNLGNEGTMADFIAWLRTPATEAAAQALQATAEALAAAQTLGQGIAAAEAAATLANTKAVLANDAALLANEKAALVDSAATLANTKAGLADAAAILATDKAGLADSKATLANEKAALAQSAADNANAKAAEVTAAVLSAGQLGSIKPTDAAPTPARNGNYTFSIGGAKPAWLTAEAGITTVKAGDGVVVVFTAPSTYTYTHVDMNSKFMTESIQGSVKGTEMDMITGFVISSSTGMPIAHTGAKHTQWLPIAGMSEVTLKANSLGPGIQRGVVFKNKSGNLIKPNRPNGIQSTSFRFEDNAGGASIDGTFPVPVDAIYYQFSVQYDIDQDLTFLSATCLVDKIKEKHIRPHGNQFLPYKSITRYSHAINTINPLIITGNEVSAAIDSEVNGTDYAIMMLPRNYDPNGKPVRLVIGCHGGGGGVTATGSQIEGFDIYRYLVANGYAVMDVGGMPQAYSIANSIDWYRVMGCLFAVNSYEKAYSYFVSNYNLARDGVMLVGMSNGGLTSNNIYAHSNIPIKCMAGLSALISMETAWNITSGAASGGLYSQYQNRANIIKIYGMTPVSTQEELNNAVIEPDKIIGFDPINYDTYMNGTNVCKRHRVPYKLWHPIDDPAVPIASVREFVQRLKNGNSFVVLREMESGGHAPDTAGTIVGTFTWGTNQNPIYPAAAELLMWFNRFN